MRRPSDFDPMPVQFEWTEDGEKKVHIERYSELGARRLRPDDPVTVLGEKRWIYSTVNHLDSKGWCVIATLRPLGWSPEVPTDQENQP